VARALHVVFGETEHFEGGDEELEFGLNIALELDVIDLLLKEVLAIRLSKFEVVQPLAEELTLHEFSRVSLFPFFDFLGFACGISFVLFQFFLFFGFHFVQVGNLG
jgi:hypothetical protein